MNRFEAGCPERFWWCLSVFCSTELCCRERQVLAAYVCVKSGAILTGERAVRAGLASATHQSKKSDAQSVTLGPLLQQQQQPRVATSLTFTQVVQANFVTICRKILYRPCLDTL